MFSTIRDIGTQSLNFVGFVAEKRPQLLSTLAC